MSRRSQAPKRTILPDPKFGSLLLAKFMNMYFESQWEGIKHKALFFGSPDDIAAKIQDFAAAGYNHFVFRAQWLGLPLSRSIEIVERFARDVMPRFR
jgi:alkanesulfonate monooxygenase SsuD/methylene tetrahydromethanopterin reductase-like flavin-dependent oxidoreductase (luciferase family)